MRIERRNTTSGQSPYAGINFRLTTSEIRNPDGSVVFRAENVEVAWRMYTAMFSFADWRLSELTVAQLTSLQVATLLAYAVVLFNGLRQFYGNPLAAKAPSAAAGAAADAGMAVPFSTTALLVRAFWLALFLVSVLKLSAQSFSPFLYFQF